MKTTEFKKKIRSINKALGKAEGIFNSLPSGMQDLICDYHHEEGSLNHCLRWGLQASEEILIDAKHVVQEYNDNY